MGYFIQVVRFCGNSLIHLNKLLTLIQLKGHSKNPMRMLLSLLVHLCGCFQINSSRSQTQILHNFLIRELLSLHKTMMGEKHKELVQSRNKLCNGPNKLAEKKELVVRMQVEFGCLAQNSKRKQNMWKR